MLSSSYFLGRIILGSLSSNFESFFTFKILYYILAGVPFIISLFFLTAFVSINYWVTLFVIIAIHIVGLISFKIPILRILDNTRGTPTENPSKLSFNVLKRSNIKDVVLVAIILAHLVHVVYVVDFLKWPPAGDAIRHGLITSLFVNNGYLSLNYEPLAPERGIETPTGYHATAAYFGTLFNVYPGESVFMLAAFFMWFILVSIFVLTYRVTKSFSLAIIGSLFALAINYTGNLESWIMGYFYNGPYPNLAGFVLVLSSLILSLEYNSWTNRRWLVIHGIISFSIVITYPLFVIFPVLFIVIRYFLDRNRKTSRDPTSKRLDWVKANYKKLIILSVVVVYSLSIAGPAISGIFSDSIVTSTFIKVTENPNYLLASDYFSKNQFGILTALGFIVAFNLILYKRQILFSSIYVVVSSMIFLSLFIPELSFILPRRSAIILNILAWITLLLGGMELSKSTAISSYFAKIHRRLSKFNPSKIIVSALMLSLVILPSLYSHASGEIIERYDWFSRDGYFLEDYQIIDWIPKNISSDDLILNDFSYTSAYLSSFAIMNLTYQTVSDNDSSVARASDALRYWKNPSDLCLLKEIVTKYDVKYVYATSEWAYKDVHSLGGGDNKYKAKPFNREVVNKQFSESPMLEPIIIKKLGGLYRINNVDAIICNSS